MSNNTDHIATQKIPVANWRLPVVKFAPVVMPIALDMDVARAVTQPLPVIPAAFRY